MGKEIGNEDWAGKVRREEERQKEKIQTCPYRMKYHIMPPVGWLNDPNGLCQFKGVYQVYFQYSPYSVNGGGGFWGHCTSRDLLHWEYREPVLTTDRDEDKSGVYSGSALVENEKIYLFYTGNVKLPGEYDYIDSGRISSQMMVISEDGQTMSEKEKLLGMEDYPDDITAHVRDPKVWKENGRYYMILGARKRAYFGQKRRDIGGALIYISQDKNNWELFEELFPQSPFGYMWECPDLFELDGKKILSYCPQGVPTEKERFQNLYQSGYSILYEGQSPEQTFKEWDMGFDFYAPQTFQTEDGRRILFGWAGVPDTFEIFRNLSVKNGWQHCLTIPRELKMENDTVYQMPVKELMELSWEKEIAEEVVFSSELIRMKIECPEKEHMGIRIGTERNSLVINVEKDKVEMTFLNNKKQSAACGGGRTARLGRTSGPIQKLLILIDNSILELFANDGEMSMTTRIYLKENERKIKVTGSRFCEIWKSKE